MSIKVYELAKELNLTSKEVLEKLGSMGVTAKGHMSVLSDIDAIAVRNIIMRGKAGTETKIVKVAPKKSEQIDEPKVVVKAAVIKPQAGMDHRAQKKQVQAEERIVTAKPPIGKPVISKELDSRPKPPPGKPVIPKEVESRTVPRPDPTQSAKMAKPKLPIKGRPEPGKEETRQEKPKYQGERPKRPEAGTDRPEQRPEHRADQRPDQRPEHRTDQRPERRPDQRPDQRPEHRADQRPEHRTDQRPEHRPNQRPDQRQDHRPGQRQDQRPPRKPDQRPDQKTDQKTDQKPAATAAKPQPKRDDKQAKGAKAGGDRGKYTKVDQGKKPKLPVKERSLEKQARPKKYQKQRPVAAEPEINIAALPVGTKVINVPITVAGFCEQLEITTSAVIMSLMRLGIMANINQNVDEDTVLVLAEELGINVVIGKVAKDVVEEGIETFKDKDEDLYVRPPIITVMGHVDHGKTSLLDAIRKTNVTASESGGITQHIGASEVTINNQKIVFLDTPGHEAFTAMRARGAHVTDIAVLVVAADDSVKPQTIESISHAKAAGVPVIVAINKIDKPTADINKVKQDLSTQGILVEDWGGSTISVPVSAKSGEGIVNLLEMILLQAEVLELKANPKRLASGTVIEARLDKAKGPVATLLVLNGALHSGNSIVAGTCSGKIRLMTNFKGDIIKNAGPATAVEILGLTEVPEAGDDFYAVKEDKAAREIAENRKVKLREEMLARNASTTLERLFSQIQEGEVKELGLIIKGDVMGSVGALEASLEKLRNENVKVRIIHTGVGTVTESDVMLAGTSGAVIIGFNVRPSTAVSAMADREKVEIRTYRVIYDAINDVEAAMKGMLDPVYKEVLLGKLEIRNIFKVPGVGNVGGAYVTDGKIVRNAETRLVRDGIVIHEGKLASLRRFKDDVKEVMQGYECGVGIENYNDIQENDVLECFVMEEIKRD